MIDTLDRIAQESERLYYGFLLQLVGSLMRVLDEPAPTSPAARASFRTAAEQATMQMLTTLKSRVEDTEATAIKEATSNASVLLSEEQFANVTSIVTEARSDMLVQIALAAEKDTQVINRALQQLALDVDRIMNLRDSTYVSALFQARMKLDTNFHFFQLDRAGRKWTSPNYVRTTIRGFLLSAYIDTYMYALASRGVDLVAVQHPEDAHPHAGLVFSISGTIPGVPAYSELKGDVWHPNSRASVAHT